MTVRALEVDYLVVGTGAMGMAFADELVSQSKDVSIILVDRRSKPGGHRLLLRAPNCWLWPSLAWRCDLDVSGHLVDRIPPQEPASLAHFAASRRSLVKHPGLSSPRLRPPGQRPAPLRAVPPSQPGPWPAWL